MAWCFPTIELSAEMAGRVLMVTRAVAVKTAMMEAQDKVVWMILVNRNTRSREDQEEPMPVPLETPEEEKAATPAGEPRVSATFLKQLDACFKAAKAK